MQTALKVAGNKSAVVGQYVLLVIPTLSAIVDDIWKAAAESQAIDFESFKQRAKAKASVA